MLGAEARASFEERGFFILRGFASRDVADAMTARIEALAREAAAGTDVGPAYVMAEPKLVSPARRPEKQVAKVFKLHRQEPVFAAFSRDPRLLAIVAALVGPDADCFLSQFVFKEPGALGQPWHQDAFYFAFDRGPQLGAWLAVTEATRDNGPLWVLPGSHREPIHRVVADARPDSLFGYVEIVDHDMAAAEPVLMQPGDLLIFHAHLMHRSTDNLSPGRRAAMVYHYTPAGTVDGTRERFGIDSPNNDFVPVLRGGRPV
jgi:ectoine hydroxylase-related dioxygenase (phytanoyl-CoA dioxygenase family)